MNTRKSLSKILTLLLSLALVFSVTPVTAFAEETAPPPGESIAGEPPVATPSGAEPITEGDPATDGNADPGDEPAATVTDGVSLGESGDTATPTDTTPGVAITIVPESEYISLSIPQGVPITDDALLKGVSAKDANGDDVAVTVADADGLDYANPQPKGKPGSPEPYMITYAAGGATTMRECFVTVGIMKLVDSGTCGDPDVNSGANVTWSLDTDTGVLSVSGAGAMADYTDNADGNPAPWYGLAITSVTIDSGVTSIGENAFLSCAALASVTIPDSVTAINRSAFWGCASLASVAIPASVTRIGLGAFRGCASLASVVIPDSVTTIEESAFWGCASLKTIRLPDSVITIENNAFHDCAALESVTLPSGITTIEYGMFDGCTSLTSISIPESVTEIGNGAFGNTGLTTVTIPASVTSIGRRAFGECDALTEVIFEGNTAPTINVGDRGAFEEPAPNVRIVYPAGGTGYNDSPFADYIPSGWVITSDTAAPTVESVTPNSTDAAISGDIVITFSESMNTTTAGTVKLNSDSALPTGGASWAGDAYTIPYSGLVYDTLYTITIEGFKDAANYTMTADSTNKFTTGIAPSVSVTKITVTSPDDSITEKGGTLQMAVTVEPSNATNKAVTWIISDGSGATINANGLLTAIANGTVTVRATAQDGSGKSGEKQITITGQDTITPAKYSLAIQAGTGGTIITGASGEYVSGAVIDIEASADSGYIFDEWTTSDGGTFADANSASTTFTMPDNATTVTASFTSIGGQTPDTYALTIQAGSGGHISLGASGEYTANTVIDIEASADRGYIFSEWTTSDGGTFANANSESTTFTMPDNATTITASFTSIGGGYGIGNSSDSNDDDNDDDSSSSQRRTLPAPTERWMIASNLRNPSRDTIRFGVRVSAWNALTGPYYHDSMSGNAVQIRTYFDSPGLFTKDTYVSGWTTGADADRIRGFFEKWFSNKIAAIHFDQTGQWETQIRVAAKLDLAGWDTKRLYLYAYDPKTNSYRHVEDSAYWFDANGYLHFQTGYAGEIIVSEGPLEKR